MDFGHFAVGVFEGQVDLCASVGLELDCSVDLAPSQKQSDESHKGRNETWKASRSGGHIESPQLQKGQAFQIHGRAC